MIAHCCESMTHHINHRCDAHPDPFDCPDHILIYSAKFDEYGIIIHDGGTSSITIKHCPFCGQRLPDSKRALWFDHLEALGINNPGDCPEDMNDDRWWRQSPKKDPP